MTFLLLLSLLLLVLSYYYIRLSHFAINATQMNKETSKQIDRLNE